MKNYQAAMKPNQTQEDYEDSLAALNSQFEDESLRLNRGASPNIEPGAEITHEEFFQEQNKLDGQANGLSENFVNNKDEHGNDLDVEVFNAEEGRIVRPENGGANKGSEKTYDSLESFKSEYGDTSITRRGGHDGAYFGVGDISYEESSLAEQEDYFDGKTVDYQIDSLPDNCKIVTGDVSEWAGHEGGGKQLLFAKTDKNGELVRDADGSIDAYSVSDLEYDGHISRMNHNEKISEGTKMANDNNARESVTDKLNSMGHKHVDAETKRNPNPESTRAALKEIKNEQSNTDNEGK